MNWYLVKLCFHIQVNKTTNQNNSEQFDIQWRLVQATNQADACLKARIIGRQNESSFENQNGNLISWQFIDVKEIILLGQLVDGQEIYSETIETDNKEKYVQEILLRALKQTLAMTTIES